MNISYTNHTQIHTFKFIYIRTIKQIFIFISYKVMSIYEYNLQQTYLVTGLLFLQN